MRRQQSGFTFMELLLVGALIAILAAILFPVFSQAQKKGQAAACLSNLQQMSIALQLYAQDHFGHFPPEDNDVTPLSAYLRDEEVFHCPGAETGETFSWNLPTYAYRGGYAHDDLPNRILVADTQPRHSGGGNLLLLNNQVKWHKWPESPYVEDGKIVVDEPMERR